MMRYLVHRVVAAVVVAGVLIALGLRGNHGSPVPRVIGGAPATQGACYGGWHLDPNSGRCVR